MTWYYSLIMRKSPMRCVCRITVGLALFAGIHSATAQDNKRHLPTLPHAAKDTIDFARDIKPIWQRSCVGCHGEKKQQAGLRLDQREAALIGSNSGAVIKPGDSNTSRLLHVVAGLDPEVKMPPKGKEPLTAIE